MFYGITLVVGVACHLWFLEELGYFIQPWYFLLPMIILAGCIDGSLAAFERWKAWRVFRWAGAAGLAALLLWPAWTHAALRMTNVDLVAQWLNREAGPQDIVIVNPWYFAPSFQRYYHGKAGWETVPPLEDRKLHRYDLIKGHMVRTDSMQPVIERLTQCLKGGNRVWVLGNVLVPRPGQNAPDVPVAPTSSNGWHDELYLRVWSLQMGQALRAHARTRERVPVAEVQSVNNLESPPLQVFAGWQDGTP